MSISKMPQAEVIYALPGTEAEHLSRDISETPYSFSFNGASGLFQSGRGIGNPCEEHHHMFLFFPAVVLVKVVTSFWGWP